jgi:predicted O-methyltransferase YrrM
MAWYGDKAWPYLKQVLKRFDDVITFHRMTSQDAFDIMDVPTIDFIHIDGNHDDVLTDCKLWLPYLKRGGIVAFHDAIDNPDHADGGYCYQTSMEGSAGYETVIHRKTDQYLLIRRKP